ncbi:calcium-activated chloride channel regulator 1-like [Ornithodoros turicata]|uniref:calcium-activated chloride channel regulator 1-like n=1 Tax=Ornithodoros turicata TaxID=34597 RepID=UPI003139983F
MRTLAAVLLVLAIFKGSLCTHVIQIDKRDGGYENIMVALHRDVTESEKLVDNIKLLFQAASDFLHRATRGRVYFKTVTIGVPSTWQVRKGVKRILADEYMSSHVRVENSPHGNNPYTHHKRNCGEHGHYIRITPEFVLNLKSTTKTNYGNPAYHLIHEWAHFRYGVFDEYAAPGDPEGKSAFYCDGGKVRLNGCSRDIKFFPATASGDKCKLYDECKVSDDCIPYADPSQVLSSESSIMFMPAMENISLFCDSRHNPIAPNKHNEKCQGKSTWEVISSNKDFVGLQARDISKPTRVTFREIQHGPQCSGRYVFVLDVSGSMQGERIKALKDAATFLLRYTFPPGFDVAIVTFSGQAQLLKGVTKLDSRSQGEFINVIQSLRAGGGTGIGAGLSLGLQALKYGLNSAEGGTIVLMTDGEENEHPYMRDVLPDLVNEKVKVSALAFGKDAEKKIEAVADATGGRTYTFNDEGSTGAAHALDSALQNAVTGDFEGCVTRITIAELSLNTTSAESIEFTIDDSVGDDTLVTIVSSSPNSLNITLLDPRGEIFTAGTRELTDTRVIIHVPSPTTAGTWKLLVENTDAGGVADFHVRISSKTKTEEAIRAIAYVNSASIESPEEARIYAELTYGEYVVLGAKVIATVVGPRGGPGVDVRLLDDGTGGDASPDDGVYSGYFTKFNGKGRYAVVIKVYGRGAAYIAHSPFPARGIPHYRLPQGKTLGPMAESFSTAAFDVVSGAPQGTKSMLRRVKRSGPFQRVANAGSFQAKEDFEEKRIPPGAITDLKASVVKKTPFLPLNTTLSWTCPGAHMDSGHASHIDIRYSVNLRQLQQNFDSAGKLQMNHVILGQMTLLPPGTRQKITVLLPSDAVTKIAKSPGAAVYFVAKAVNGQNITSEISNIAVAFRPPRCCSIIIGSVCVPCPQRRN